MLLQRYTQYTINYITCQMLNISDCNLGALFLAFIKENNFYIDIFLLYLTISLFYEGQMSGRIACGSDYRYPWIPATAEE